MNNSRFLKIGTIVFLLVILSFSVVATISSPANRLSNVVSIVAILSGVSSILISLYSSSITSLEAVKEYFFQSDSPGITNARHKVYNNDPEQISIEDKRTMCNFFEFWGMMARKGYLPLWIFENAAGLSVLKVYDKVKEHIVDRRIDNMLYAKNFLWLVKKIENSNKEAVSLKNSLTNRKELESDKASNSI